MLSGQAGGWRLGWGVLASRGMAAWIVTQDEVPVPPHQDPARVSIPDVTIPDVSMPAGHAAALVAVMAGMALACLRPRHDRHPHERGDAHAHRHRRTGGPNEYRSVVYRMIKAACEEAAAQQHTQATAIPPRT